ncbi:12680_t:CDS:2 [Rhizophagus irregularis]|nr:12680_t:CDS:2 [Rhizophagus irregularis]
MTTMTDNILTESNNENILTRPRSERVSIVLSSTSSETLSIDTLSLDAQSFKSIKKIPNPTDILRNVKKDIKNFISKDKQRKKENDFLGYYECRNTTSLLNPKISLSTARINLHEGESVDEARRLVITKIKNSPYLNNVSIFIITGKGNHMNSTNNPGILNKSFLDWMKDDSIKNLVDGDPIKGDAGYYMKGPNENHFEAESWYKKAEKLGSIEAKLCLGYMHSIGKLRFDPKRAKDLFKEVINKLEKSKSNKDKELSRIAMRNMALIYHNSDSISAYNLGLLYESDINGIKKVDYQAEYYFKKAVDFDNNNLYAKAKLGRFLINKNDEKEKQKGFKMLEETSNIGFVMSQTYLGEYYEKIGNFEDAIKFYFKASKQNRGRYSHIAQYRFKELSKIILESFERDLEYGYINCVDRLKDNY